MALPDFLIVGAMKCGTSTLAAQLANQPGVFMADEQEINFFSDDPIYAKGLGWYEGLFADADPSDIKGEVSTHYTKLPTYPDALARIVDAVPNPKIIYMIRNPISRAVSQYIHEWSMGNMGGDIDDAFAHHPELVAYSRYAEQIEPYIERFGVENVFISSQEKLFENPDRVLKDVCAFLGYTGTPEWRHDRAAENVSAERIRRFPLHGLIFDNPVAAFMRRTLVPKSIRDKIKKGRQMRTRPTVSDALKASLEKTFAADYQRLIGLHPDASSLSSSYPFVNR